MPVVYVMIDFKKNDLADMSLEELKDYVRTLNDSLKIESTYIQAQKGNVKFDYVEYKELLDEFLQSKNALEQLSTKLNQEQTHFNTTVISNAKGSVKNKPREQFNEEQKVRLQEGILKVEEVYVNIIRYIDENSGFNYVFQQLERHLIQIKEDVTTEIKGKLTEGIGDLVNLKSELGLSENFQEKIDTELDDAKTKEKKFFWCFIASLIAIPVLVLLEHFLLVTPNAIDSYILKGSITLALLLISYFLFNQYKTYMIIRIRYTHLGGFLGGGATFLSGLIDSEDSELKSDVNKRLAELFMSLDDVQNMIKKTKHPSEISLDKAVDVFDKVTKITK